MPERPFLIPAPRRLEWNPADADHPGELNLSPATLEGKECLIVLDSQQPAALYPTARMVQEVLNDFENRWKIVAGPAHPDLPPGLQSGISSAESVCLVLRVVPGSQLHEQGYSLVVTANGIEALANSPVGIYYAAQTLRQLILTRNFYANSHSQNRNTSINWDEAGGGLRLPLLRILDWPDYPNRGVMLDISRDKVPSMQTLYALVDMLTSFKINQLQLYTEHTFAYRNYPEVWAEASPLTGEETLALDDYCRERFIELVPNQNTFGHLRPWLIHPRFRDLAEAPNGCDTRWGRFDQPFSLNPTNPASLELVRSMLDELLPHYTSSQVNVGCDETVDLGEGASREAVQRLGVGQVYLDFLLKIHQEVRRRGRQMQFWGDIIMEHPELVPQLPRDVFALEWGYEADHPFADHAARFAASGVPFYVCPGTSSWNSIAGRTENALGNLRNAAENGLRNGAVGYLITDWGDNGHWQPLPVSYLGFAAGAAYSWAYQANQDLDVIRALDQYVFQDLNRAMGRLVSDLGNIYQAPGVPVHNGSILFHILQSSPAEIREFWGAQESPEEHLRVTLGRIDQVMAGMEQANLHCADAELVRREFAWVAEMLRHACRRAIWALQDTTSIEKNAKVPDRGEMKRNLAVHAAGLQDEFHQIWHARNRPGGFQLSIARFEQMRHAYLESV